MKFFWQPEEGKQATGKYFLASILVVFGFLIVGTTVATFALLTFVPNATKALELGDFTQVNKNSFLVTNLLPFLVGLGFALLAAKRIVQKPLRSFMTLRPAIDRKRFALGFLVWMVIAGIPILIDMQLNASHYKWNFQPANFILLCCIALIMLPLQTLFEEVLLRGFFLQFFGTRFRKGIVGLIGTGLIFCALHLSNSEVTNLGWGAIFFYLFSGWMTALVTTMDDGIEISWGFHTANNVIGIVLFTNSWQSLQTDALYVDRSDAHMGWDIYVTMTVGYVVFVLFFALFYRWKNWKQRLF